MSRPLLGQRVRIVLGHGPHDSHIYDMETGEELTGVYGLLLDLGSDHRQRTTITLRVELPAGSEVEGQVGALEPWR